MLCYHPLFLCTVCVLSIAFVNSQDPSFSPPNIDGWQNPDDTFLLNHPEKPERKFYTNEDVMECQKSVKAWAGRFSACYNSLIQEKKLRGSSEMSTKQCYEDVDGSTVYLQRFVRHLLEVSNLDSSDVVSINTAELQFSVSDKQLDKLRKFAKEGNTKVVPLRRLDEIFLSAFKKPFFNIPSQNINWDKIGLEQIESNFYGLLPVASFFSCLWMTRAVRKSLVLMLVVGLVTSYIMTFKRMREEARLKHYKEMKECMSSSDNSNCRNDLNPDMEVTFLSVIRTMFVGETLRSIMRDFGGGFVDFYQEFDRVGFFQSFFAVGYGVVALFLFFILLFLVCTGGSFNLPFFMGGVSFSSSNKGDNRHTTTSEAKSRVQDIPQVPNITLNIHNQPHDIHGLLRSLSQNTCSVIPDPLGFRESVTFQDSDNFMVERLAGGDQASLPVNHDETKRMTLLKKAPPKPGFSSVSSKKVQSPFSQLQAKYKSSNNTTSKSATRKRHLSM